MPWEADRFPVHEDFLDEHGRGGIASGGNIERETSIPPSVVPNQRLPSGASMPDGRKPKLKPAAAGMPLLGP